MIPSRVVAAPGVRTIARPGWRVFLGIAIATVLGQPVLWLIGTLGFALRGGILLITLSILVLPTPVEVRLMLGSSIGSTGLTGDFWSPAVVGAAAGALGLIGILLAVSRLEVAAFNRFVRDPETADLRSWRPAPAITAHSRRRMLASVFLVQALSVLALAIAAVPLASAIGPAVLDEVLRPSSGQGIYARVLERVIPQLAFVVVAIVIVDVLSALTTRFVLLRGYGLAPRAGLSRAGVLNAFNAPLSAVAQLVRSPGGTVATAVAGWLATLVVLVPALWALGAAWQTTRAAFLATTSVGDLLSRPEVLLAAPVLAAVVLLALLLGGLASALRASAWTVEALRRQSNELD